MPFKSGESGNPAGRPKGSLNKANTELRNKILVLIESNFEQLTEDIAGMQPRDRVRALSELLGYVLGKAQPETATRLEDLSNEDLNLIINKILKA